MFREELKAELKQNYDSIKNIDKEIINIKVAIHNMEKLGLDTKEFYDNIENADTSNEKKEVLRKTLVLSFNYTLKDLMKEDRRIDSDTIDARNYFLMTKNCF